MLKLTAYIPHYPVEPRLQLRQKLIALAGGCTSTTATGDWVDAQGYTETETVYCMEVLCSDDLVGSVEALLWNYKWKAEQQEVLYTMQELKINRLL